MRYFYDILICFSTENLEKIGCLCDRCPIFFEDHAGGKTLGTTDKTHDLGMLFWWQAPQDFDSVTFHFQEIRKGCSYKPQMLLVCESREMVLSYSEAFKALGSTEQVTVYGAFSGRLQHGEGTVDENSYNGSLHEALGSNVDMHKKSDVLVICDRFETGYDNSAVTLLGIDRKRLCLY